MSAPPDPPRAAWPLARQILLVLAVVGLLGLPTLGADFIWDDQHQIVEAAALPRLDSLPAFWTTPLGVGLETSHEHGELYRPLFSSWLWLVFRVRGADPVLFHASSLLLHLAVTGLLMVLSARWLRGWAWSPLAVGLLFGLHPATAEAWLFVSSSPDLLAALGLLGWLLCLDPLDEAPPSPARVALGTLCLGLGFSAKELALMSLPALSGLLLWWRGRGWRTVAPAWGVAGLFVLTRTWVLGEGAGTAGAPDRVLHHALLLPLDGMRALVMMPAGLRHLSLDYAEIGTAGAVAAGLGALGLLGLAWRGRARQPLWLAALVAMGATLLPVAMPSTMHTWGGFSRYLYVPSMWVLLAAVGSLGSALRWPGAARWRRTSPRSGPSAREDVDAPDPSRPARVPRARSAVTAILLIGLIAGLQTLGLRQALIDYSSNNALVRSQLRKNPRSWSAWVYLADRAMEQRDLSQAEEAYLHAVAIQPENAHAQGSLGMLRLARDPQLALEHLDIALTTAPTAPTLAAAAVAHLQLGQTDAARARVAELRALDPQAPQLPMLEQRLAATP